MSKTKSSPAGEATTPPCLIIRKNPVRTLNLRGGAWIKYRRATAMDADNAQHRAATIQQRLIDDAANGVADFGVTAQSLTAIMQDAERGDLDGLRTITKTCLATAFAESNITEIFGADEKGNPIDLSKTADLFCLMNDRTIRDDWITAVLTPLHQKEETGNG